MATGTILQKRKPALALVSMVLALMMTSCNKNVVYSKYQTFSGNEWFMKDKAVFDVDITDTQSLNNISLMVRHADSYPYSNLFLFVTTKYPDGKVLGDTMEIVLATQKGEWQGSGAGDIYDLKVPIKKNVRFVTPGKYQFTFEQGMRVDPLPLIMDLGFEIEKSEK
ncbi:MAG TPA: gliding motility lipoprotein GldH [Bacteroidia bacterium]|nr:gliding motility lipoprotein GldH [Bacteroidia bacterium]